MQDVIEAAIGGEPIEVTVEGRQRFTINVRYPSSLRQDVESLRQVLVPIHQSAAASGGGGMSSLERTGAPAVLDPALLLASNGMSDSDPAMDDKPAPKSPSGMGGSMGSSSGTGSRSMSSGASGAGDAAAGVGRPVDVGGWGVPSGAHVPLGQVADIHVASGPPMIRDEAGMLVGYVYVDMDAARRDIGSYVADAKRAVAAGGEAPARLLPQVDRPVRAARGHAGPHAAAGAAHAGARAAAAVRQLRPARPALIVLASVPFALVGSIWLLALLHYNLSTAVWVGLIALVGLATQTGVVMVVYCDVAYLKAKREGRIRGFDDIVEATLEGSVQRVRPKLMTVATMMIGLVPLLWSQGAGADVMKRVAAPMVGGLFTSAFLTLEIIPVVYTYWRHAQWKREQRAARASS